MCSALPSKTRRCRGAGFDQDVNYNGGGTEPWRRGNRADPSTLLRIHSASTLDSEDPNEKLLLMSGLTCPIIWTVPVDGSFKMTLTDKLQAGQHACYGCIVPTRALDIACACQRPEHPKTSPLVDCSRREDLWGGRCCFIPLARARFSVCCELTAALCNESRQMTRNVCNGGFLAASWRRQWIQGLCAMLFTAEHSEHPVFLRTASCQRTREGGKIVACPHCDQNAVRVCWEWGVLGFRIELGVQNIYILRKVDAFLQWTDRYFDRLIGRMIVEIGEDVTVVQEEPFLWARIPGSGPRTQHRRSVENREPHPTMELWSTSHFLIKILRPCNFDVHTGFMAVRMSKYSHYENATMPEDTRWSRWLTTGGEGQQPSDAVGEGEAFHDEK